MESCPKQKLKLEGRYSIRLEQQLTTFVTALQTNEMESCPKQKLKIEGGYSIRLEQQQLTTTTKLTAQKIIPQVQTVKKA